MRISDWSSDVCSSDLFVSGFGDKALEAGFVNLDLPHRSGEHAAVLNQKGFGGISANDNPRRQRQPCAIEDAIRNFHRSRLFDTDRKSDVAGKRVSVSVDLGGRRLIKKKNKKQQ